MIYQNLIIIYIMNLLDKKLGLLLVTALLLFSCEEEVGELNITPENNLGIFFAQTSLEDKISQVWAGSARSSFNGTMLVGNLSDSVLGQIKSSGFGDISVERAIYDTATIRSAEIISLNFNLRINNLIGDFDESAIQTLGLYKLNEPISEISEISSSSIFDIDSKIGETQFQLFRDSLNLFFEEGANVADYDENGIYKYVIPFSLSEDYKSFFIESFRDAILRGVPESDTDVDSVSFYLDENLKGVAILAEGETNAILSFDINNALNYDFDLVYSLQDLDGSTIERTANFLINSLKSFNSILPNENEAWSGGVFDGITVVNELNNGVTDDIYVNSGTNILCAIDLSDFVTIRDTIPNVIITRAVININNVSTLSNDLPLMRVVNVTFSNEDRIKDGVLSSIDNSVVLSELPTIVGYDTLNQSLSIEMPLFLQSLVEQEVDFDQIIIGSDLIQNDLQFGNDTGFSGFSFKKQDVSISYFYTKTD